MGSKIAPRLLGNNAVRESPAVHASPAQRGTVGAPRPATAGPGNPVEHSLSPAIHNRAFAELGLDFVYLAFRVEDVRSALSGMRALENFRGMSVTIPHKVAILDVLDEIDEVDRQIGSINTVVNEHGRLIGSGSDGPGARQALHDAGIEPGKQNVLILGSGGAARAIAFNLAHDDPPASLTILGILEDELGKLADDLREKTRIAVSAGPLTRENLARYLAASSVLIHATPIGMHPKVDASLVPPELLHTDLSVMDIVYNPYQTQLLRNAEAKGLKVIPGIEMFVNQAMIQFEKWTGQAAPRGIMREVVLDHLTSS
jgi:shikimate dehydrogenase